MVRIGLSVAVLILISAAVAQTVNESNSRSHFIWEPPEWNTPQDLKGSVPKEMLSTLHLSGYPITFEETSIKSVQNYFGFKAGQKGDAGDALTWLCFHGADRVGRWVVWLESAEIDGGDVGSFQWQRVSDRDVLDSRCHALTGDAVRLPLGFRLETKKAEVLKRLGQPTFSDFNMLIYLNEREETIRGQRFDTWNLLQIHFRNGLAWRIEASKTSSS